MNDEKINELFARLQKIEDTLEQVESDVSNPTGCYCDYSNIEDKLYDLCEHLGVRDDGHDHHLPTTESEKAREVREEKFQETATIGGIRVKDFMKGNLKHVCACEKESIKSKESELKSEDSKKWVLDMLTKGTIGHCFKSPAENSVTIYFKK